MTERELQELAETTVREAYWQRIENGAMQMAAAWLVRGVGRAMSHEQSLAIVRDSVEFAKRIVDEIDRRNVAQAREEAQAREAMPDE